MNELTEAELGYLAGLLDGEGCINITKDGPRYYKLQVTFSQTNEALLSHWQQRTGIGKVYLKPVRGRNRSDCWEWHMNHQRAATLLRAILPYVILKKQEATVAIEFMDMCAKQLPSYHGGAMTDEMLETREAYKDKLHDLKAARAGRHMA